MMPNNSLGAWGRVQATDEELRSIFSGVASEPNHRAAALEAAAIAEIGLSSSLRARLTIKDQAADRALFDQGPLSTFANKIKMAEALGIIGPSTRDNFNHIKTIRNAFAHTARAITFDVPEVASTIGKLRMTVKPIRPRIPQAKTARDKYVYCCLSLFIVLEEMARQIISKAPSSYSNYTFVIWVDEKRPASLP